MNGSGSSASQTTQTSPPVPYPVPHDGMHPSTILAVVLAVVLIVLATILVLNHGTLTIGGSGSTGNPPIVLISAINRNITYLGGLPHYFGPTVNDSCPYCPVGAQQGGAIRIPMATWSLPGNLSFWVFTNVTGPFPVLAGGCGGVGCTIPWVTIWSEETYVPAHTLSSMTLFAIFQLTQPVNGYYAVTLNATFCPSWVCTEVPPP
jgi:hypothetical protein